MDDDDLGQPQRNGNSNRQEQRKHGTDWKQMLLETGMDEVSLKARRNLFPDVERMNAHLAEAAIAEQNKANADSKAINRNRTNLVIAGLIVTVLTGTVSFFSNVVANASRPAPTIVVKLPSGNSVTVTPSPDPTEGQP